VPKFFMECVRAIQKDILIERDNPSDKEFHFQNWVRDRLKATQEGYFASGRNSFPDFTMVNSPVGFEVKGLASPGRYKSYDGNSQAPKGRHNGRTIYYVFGRYPKNPVNRTYPVLDLVVCPGNFLNADSFYVHENKNVKGFGSYGDIMIRDRKMYVIPTPYSLVDGLGEKFTLITPYELTLPEPFVAVGDLIRVESKECLTSYNFNLASNELTPTIAPNAGAGTEHWFKGWRLDPQPGDGIKMRSLRQIIKEVEKDADETE